MTILFIQLMTTRIALYAQYKQLADQEKNVIFGGRLAEYKYYDMAPIIEKVLEIWKK
jgi:UDP-galactopyranose mutase